MNYQNAIQMFDFAKHIKADAVYYTLIDPIPGYTDSLLLNPGQSNELLGMIDEIEKKSNSMTEKERIELENFDQFKRRLSNPDAEGGHYDNNIIDSIPCYIGWMFCRLLPDGKVSPCCRGVNKPLGNLFQNSFEEIWNSQTYGEFRHNAKHLKKGHPYFHPIGCDTTCDNLMHNLDMHRRILEIYPELETELTTLK
jgi:radical SAM protein with 4Fe4S-binding SPASM domain